MNEQATTRERSAALRVDAVGKQYPTRADPLVVLRDVQFTVEPGCAAVITGPSGCGKSTLLSIIGGLEPPSSGTVRLGDCDPYALSEDELAAYRNRRVGFIFQDHHLLPQCSALENVLIPTLAGGADPQARSRAEALLHQVGLDKRKDHLPSELSGGERQRVAAARALIQNPDLLLADEPTGNLDRRTADVLASMLFDLQRESGTMMLMVTHSAELAERFRTRFELIDGSVRTLSRSGA
jgi:lipoprotein-releasing system ATP-binding protein